MKIAMVKLPRFKSIELQEWWGLNQINIHGAAPEN